MKVKKAKKKGRKRPETVAKDTLKYAIANGTIKDLLWDHDEEGPHNESESSEEEDLEDHAIEVFNELLLRHVPNVPESELLTKYRQQFIEEHSLPGTKQKHHLAPFPPAQERGSFLDSPTRSRQIKLVPNHPAGSPPVKKQPPFDRTRNKKHVKPNQFDSAIAEPLPLTQLESPDGHETQPSSQHRHHYHDAQLDTPHKHVTDDVPASLAPSLDLQFRPTSFGNLARSMNNITEDSRQNFKTISGSNLSRKASTYRTVHEELNIMQDDDVLWGGVLGPRSHRRTTQQLNRPDERTMAELFDLSHTLRRERELSSGSAAHLDLTENKEVLPHFGEPGGPKKTQFNNKTNSETSKQTRKSVHTKKNKSVALDARAPAVPTANQDFQSFWNEECSYSVTERFRVPGIDTTKSNLNTNTTVTTVTEEGATEPEAIIVDEKEELRNRARELVASLHNFSAIDTKSDDSDSESTAAIHSRDSNTHTSATAASNDVDIDMHKVSSTKAKRHSVHTTTTPSASTITANHSIQANTRNTILSTTNSSTISKLFPQLQHHLRHSSDSPVPPAVTVEAVDAPAPNQHIHIDSSDANLGNSRHEPGVDDDNQSIHSDDSSMNDSIEYGSQDNATDGITLQGLSLSAESDNDSVSINLSSPRQKHTSDADYSDSPKPIQNRSAKQKTTVVRTSSSVNTSPNNERTVSIEHASKHPTTTSSASNKTALNRDYVSLPSSPGASSARIPQVPSAPFTSPVRPRVKAIPPTEDQMRTKSSTSTGSPAVSASPIVASNKSTKRNNSSKTSAEDAFTDTITSASVREGNASKAVENIYDLRLNDSGDDLAELQGPSIAPKDDATVVVDDRTRSAQDTFELGTDNTSMKDRERQKKIQFAEPSPLSPTLQSENRFSHTVVYKDDGVSVQTYDGDGVDESPIKLLNEPTADVGVSISVAHPAPGGLTDNVVDEHAERGHTQTITEPHIPPHSHHTTSIAYSYKPACHTTTLLPFGLEHLKGIWPYDPSISAYQYMLHLYAQRRIDEQKQRERNVHAMRERRKQKQDRQPLPMKHALSETYQVLTFDPEHLYLVLSTHTPTSLTPIHTINISIHSTYITENHTTNMITLRTTDDTVPGGYLATYSISQYICMENEINAALAAYELSRFKLRNSISEVVAVATDYNSEDAKVGYSPSVRADGRSSNASSPSFSASVVSPRVLSPNDQSTLHYSDDEEEESGVFLTATTGASIPAMDTSAPDHICSHDSVETAAISIQQLRHYAEQGYASFLAILRAEEPLQPEMSQILAPSPHRPSCVSSSTFSIDSGPIRPLLLPTRSHTLQTDSVHSTVQPTNDHSISHKDHDIVKSSVASATTVQPDSAPLPPLPSRFAFLIKDAVAAVKAAEAEREHQRLLELQRQNQTIAPVELYTQSSTIELSEHHKRNFRFYDPHSKLSVYELQSQLSTKSGTFRHNSVLSATSGSVVHSTSNGYSTAGHVARGESVSITIEGTSWSNA